MELWLTELGMHGPLLAYLAICSVLIISGFGLPIPEDIPLLVAGYLCALGYADIWVMGPLCFVSIMGADGMVYILGRKYGMRINRIRFIRRFLTPKRLAKAENMLHQHGGKFMFAARFMPGVRTPSMFTAGMFRVPYWKFLSYDGAAAGFSVPTILFLGYYFSAEIAHAKKLVMEGQLAAIGIIVLLAALWIAWHLRKRRQEDQTTTDETPKRVSAKAVKQKVTQTVTTQAEHLARKASEAKSKAQSKAQSKAEYKTQSSATTKKRHGFDPPTA